jgi:uncharacterized protein
MTLTVRNAEARARYELVDDDEEVLGVADYRVDGDVVTFPHTEVRPDRRGQGLGAVLVRAALDDVRRQGRHIHPACWYVREFVVAHDDYADLVA